MFPLLLPLLAVATVFSPSYLVLKTSSPALAFQTDFELGFAREGFEEKRNYLIFNDRARVNFEVLVERFGDTKGYGKMIKQLRDDIKANEKCAEELNQKRADTEEKDVPESIAKLLEATNYWRKYGNTELDMDAYYYQFLLDKIFYEAPISVRVKNLREFCAAMVQFEMVREMFQDVYRLEMVY